MRGIMWMYHESCREHRTHKSALELSEVNQDCICLFSISIFLLLRRALV